MPNGKWPVNPFERKIPPEEERKVPPVTTAERPEEELPLEPFTRIPSQGETYTLQDEAGKEHELHILEDFEYIGTTPTLRSPNYNVYEKDKNVYRDEWELPKKVERFLEDELAYSCFPIRNGNHIEISSLLRLSDWMDVLDNNTIMVDPSTVSKKIRFVQYQNTSDVRYLSKSKSKVFIKQAIKTELQLLESINYNSSLGCREELVAKAYKHTN